MQITLSDIDIRTPGSVLGSCGVISEARIEFDSTQSWPSCLSYPEAIEVESIYWSGRKDGRDVYRKRWVRIDNKLGPEADLLVAIIKAELERRFDTDARWLDEAFETYSAARSGRAEVDAETGYGRQGYGVE